MPVVRESSHETAMTGTGVEQSDRDSMTMAGRDLLFLSHRYLGVVVHRRV